MSDYPLPSYAAHIWVAGGEIYLAFPSPYRQTPESSTTIKLPATPRGMGAALAILQERTHNSNLIGTNGAPVIHDMERALSSDARYNEWLKAMNATSQTSVEEKAAAEEFLADLGL